MLLTSILTYSTLANPTPPVINVDSPLQNISAISPSTLNTSLSDDWPGGPSDFVCVAVTRTTVPIQPRDIFVTFIELLENITQADFNSSMPQATTRFRGSSYLEIVVESVNPSQPIFRRYIMWSIVSIMTTMRVDERVGYNAAVFEPRWKSQKVGTIRVGYTNGTTTATMASPTPSQASNTITSAGTGQLWWILQPLGPEIVQWSVAMGTIGGLVNAARLSDGNLVHFSGGIIPYFGAVCYYDAATQPSRLSKSILIKSMASAAGWAFKFQEYHALKVKVLIDGQVIANGGYDAIWPFESIDSVDSQS